MRASLRLAHDADLDRVARVIDLAGATVRSTS